MGLRKKAWPLTLSGLPTHHQEEARHLTRDSGRSCELALSPPFPTSLGSATGRVGDAGQVLVRKAAGLILWKGLPLVTGLMTWPCLSGNSEI